MTNIPALPQNIDPRIAEILRQRAAQGVTINKTEAVSQPKPQPAPSNVRVAQSPAPQVSQTSLGDAELASLLAKILPMADALIMGAMNKVRNDGKLTVIEALALVPDIRNIVSMVVGQLLPQIKGQSAYDLVTLVLSALVQEYVSPRLPAVLRPYLTAQAIRSAVKGLQWAYDQWVKPRLKSVPV